MNLSEKQRTYALEHLGVNQADISPSDIVDLFLQLSRNEEVVPNARRDQWGNWEAPFSDSFYDGKIFNPWLDRPGNRPSIWPDQRPFALFLSHDVDHVTRYPSMADLLKYAHRLCKGQVSIPQFTKKVAAYAYSKVIRKNHSPFDDIEEWINLEAGLNFKSTFYFFPDRVTDPHPWDCCYSYSNSVNFFGGTGTVAEAMVKIRDKGWEIGLHPSVKSHLSLTLLLDQKKQVEVASKGPVDSVRQHYLSYEMRTTPEIHADCGFLTDSTHGFNRFIGFRAGTSYPYFVWSNQNQQVTPVLELPLNIMDVALISPGGLECDTEMAIKRGMKMMAEVEKVGGVLGLNWHPECRVDPRVKSIYQFLLKEAHRKGAWGASASMIHSHLSRNLKSSNSA